MGTTRKFHFAQRSIAESIFLLSSAAFVVTGLLGADNPGSGQGLYFAYSASLGLLYLSGLAVLILLPSANRAENERLESINAPRKARWLGHVFGWIAYPFAIIAIALCAINHSMSLKSRGLLHIEATHHKVIDNIFVVLAIAFVALSLFILAILVVQSVILFRASRKAASRNVTKEDRQPADKDVF